MPNRILKESICTSDEIDALTPLEEIFFYRLMVNCDDYGCMDARPRILIARLFPLKKVKESFIISALDNLSGLNLIELYAVNGRPYLHMTSWEDHQQIRAHKHKYPYFDDDNANSITAEDIGYQMQSDDIKCNQSWDEKNGYQMISDDINGNQSQSDDIICVPNPIQSESNPNPNPNPIIAQSDVNLLDEIFDDEVESKKIKKCSQKKKKEVQVDNTPVVCQLILNDGTYYDVHQSEVDYYKSLYENVNIEQEYKNMRGWLHSNKTKRKTKSGIQRFINSWLAKEQNKYKPSTQSQSTYATNTEHKNPFAEMAMRNEGDC